MFEISADPSNATAAIARFEAETGQRLNQTAEHAKEATGAMAEGLDFLKEQLVFTVGEFANLAREAYEAAAKAAEFGEQVEHAAHQTGMMTEEVSGLSFAAKQTGIGGRFTANGNGAPFAGCLRARISAGCPSARRPRR
jgi:hypothetical protein